MLQGKWTVLAQFWRGKTLLARAEQEVYCISAETLRPVAVPARLREAFNAACAADIVQGSAGDSSK
jgi:acyl-CoA thioesterase FadM